MNIQEELCKTKEKEVTKAFKHYGLNLENMAHKARCKWEGNVFTIDTMPCFRVWINNNKILTKRHYDETV